MSKFTTPLRIEAVENSDRDFKILEAFEYYTNLLGDERIIISVPKDFITDFASVPRWLWWLFPPYGLYGKAAVIHDFLYTELSKSYKITKAQADKIFLEALEVLGVPTWKRNIIYLAVKLFGSKYFKGYSN